MRKVVALALAAGVIAGGLVLFTANSQAPEAGPPQGVLLITIDTLRADAVGEDTPGLKAFLAKATRFTAARAPVPLTLPSHLSMLSGLDPVEHGLHDNAAPPLPRDRGFVLLAEEFAGKGFATAAFVSCAVLGPRTGLDAGFATFECPEYGERWSGDPGDIPAEERLDGALSWLGSLPEGQRWFLWVHFFDPHDPYSPWKGDAKRAGTSGEQDERRLYLGEVRRADAAVERLLDAVGEDALVVIASDHGESLGEHGEPSHGNLCYATTMDAFLAVRGPGWKAGAMRTEPLGLRDVADLLRGRQPAGGGVVTGESLLAHRTHGWGQVFCAFDGRFALVETGPRVELFDRQSDPGERNPLDPSGHEAYERLDQAIARLRAGGAEAPEEEFIADSASPYGSARRPVSGYLARPANGQLRDPGDGFGFSSRVHAARRLFHLGLSRSDTGQLRAAAGQLAQLAQEDATSPQPLYYLGHVQSALGEHGEAASSAAEAIRRGYRVAPVLFLLLKESVASKDPRALRAAIDVATGVRIVPDQNCGEQLVRAALALGEDEAHAAARKYLERHRFLELAKRLR